MDAGHAARGADHPARRSSPGCASGPGCPSRGRTEPALMLALASLHAAPDGPHRLRRMLLAMIPTAPIDYETDILQGNLVAMDGAVYLRRHCRRGHGEVDEPVRGGPRPLGVPPAMADADPRDHARTRRQHPADPDGLPRRARRSPDPALVRAPARHHRELQPRMPDLLRRGGAGHRPVRAAAAHPPLARRRDRARGRPGRRADAVGRRADGPSRGRSRSSRRRRARRSPG